MRQAILLMEPDANLSGQFCAALRPLDLEVTAVQDVPQLRRALELTPDCALVVLDVSASHPEGMELLLDLRARAPDTVVLTTSTTQEAATAVRALRAGAVDHFIKDQRCGLAFCVQRALHRRAQDLELRNRNRVLEALTRDSAQQLDEQQRDLVATQHALLKVFWSMVELRDADSGQHEKAVGRLSRQLAEQLAQHGEYRTLVDAAFVEAIEDAATLHDVGMLGVPERVLFKPDHPSPLEWEIIRRHTTVGRAAILRVAAMLPPSTPSLTLEMAADIAGGHHERFDGSGYPAGLRGARIPLSARIVAVADCFEACTSRRVYRVHPMDQHAALRHLQSLAGSQLDPVVVHALEQVLGGDTVAPPQHAATVAG